MPHKTFVPNEILTSSDVNDYLMDQAVMTFPSETARNVALPAPKEGMVCYLTDANPRLSYWSGTLWRYVDLQWRSWTPTWTSVSDPQPELGGGSITGLYKRLGSECVAWFRMETTGTTTSFGTGNWRFTLPTDAVPTTRDFESAGIGQLHSTITGARELAFTRVDNGGNFVQLRVAGTGGIVDKDTPFTWIPNDDLDSGWFRYII